MAKVREISITLVMDEDTLKEMFEEREIKYKKKYLDEIQEMVEDDFSTVEETLTEIIEDIIADNYEE